MNSEMQDVFTSSFPRTENWIIQ